MVIEISSPANVHDQSQLTGVVEGERRKDLKLDHLRIRRHGFIRDAQRAMLQRLLVNETCTLDDIQSAIARHEGVDSRWQGSIPKSLSIAGIISRKAVVKSSRPTRHASLISVWELADRAAAEKWLLDNPPPLS